MDLITYALCKKLIPSDTHINELITAEIDDFANKITDDGVVNNFKEIVDWVASHEDATQTLVNSLTNFSDEYSATNTYALGELVVYNGKLYTNTTAIDTPEEFDKNKWKSITVEDLIKDLLVEVDNSKVDKEEGKGLSTNDFTDEEKNKLAAIGQWATL